MNERNDADAWRAARVSIGALGVVTALTLRTVPAFTLHAIDRSRPLGEVLDTLEDLTDTNDHFEFYNFPYSDIALTRSNNRVDVPFRPRSRSKAWFDDVFVVNHLLALVCRTGRRLPATIPHLNRLASRLAGSKERIDRSYLIFASRRDARFTEMEYVLPRAHAAAGVRAVREIVERKALSVPLPMEVRFVAADDALLSPAHARATVYMAVHMFEGMDYRRYFTAVEEAKVSLGGRPHWGKRHRLEAADLSELYPGWTPFASIRSRLDPGGRFTNAYIQRVLGPV